MADLGITVGRIALNNPVVPASGTFGIGHARVFDLDRLGALIPKTVMPTPRTGHPAPRLTEAAGGLLNAIGIPTGGVDAYLEKTLPPYLAHRSPVIVSASADTVESFAALVARFEGTGVAGLELNLSCPNLEAGGRAFALDPAPTGAVVEACRAATALPLWVKLSPNAGAPVEVAKAAAGAGADALVLSNTSLGMALRPDGRPKLANRTGGLSGAPVKPVGLRIVDEVARAVPIDIVGCGGVATLADLLDYLAVGARAVAVGTATLARPSTMVDIVDALAAHLDGLGLAARDLVRTPR